MISLKSGRIQKDDTQRQRIQKKSHRVASERCKETDDGFVSCNDKHDTENIPRGIPRTLRTPLSRITQQ
jgi:hypothetical protein